MQSFIPTHSAGQGGDEIPAGLPAQALMGFINLQMRKMGIVGFGWVTLIKRFPLYVFQDNNDLLTDGAIAGQPRDKSG